MYSQTRATDVWMLLPERCFSISRMENIGKWPIYCNPATYSWFFNLPNFIPHLPYIRHWKVYICTHFSWWKNKVVDSESQLVSWIENGSSHSQYMCYLENWNCNTWLGEYKNWKKEWDIWITILYQQLFLYTSSQTTCFKINLNQSIPKYKSFCL